MRKVYLDNAATTQLRPEVITEMVKVLTEDYGNPSSTHTFGRQAKNVLELSRKSIAKNLNADAREIIFTSGATEANNWILRSAVTDLKVERIITSKIEHHAVLHAIEHLQKEFGIAVDFVKIKPTGEIDLGDLTALLNPQSRTLVSLMHVNNEIGTVLDVEAVARICKQSNAYFHCDTVQSVGKIKMDLQTLAVDFMVASAHKFHGPKGIGFAFVRKGLPIQPLIHGGEQEKGLRAGTESIHNIVGMAKALEISLANLEQEREYILGLRDYAIEKFEEKFPGVKINGSHVNGFYNLLNVCLPMPEEKAIMILFNLDMKGIAVSRGSACQSGSAKASHVLAEMLVGDDLKKPSLRVSFSHYNDTEEIDYLVDALLSI